MNTPIKTPLKVHGALFLVALIYGSTYAIAKGVMPQYLGPSAFIFIRITIAAILFNLIAKINGIEKIKCKSDYIELVVAAFFGVAANMLFFFNGLAYTTELNASSLMLNAPIFVLIFSRVLLKEKIKWWQVVGMFVAAIGAVMLIGGWKFEFKGGNVRGDIMILLNATSFAFFLVYSKRILKKYKPLTMIRWAFVFGWFFVLPFAFNEIRAANFLTFPARIWFSIMYVSLATTFIAYLLNAWAIQKVSPTVAGSYIYLQPLIATSLGIAMGKQLLSVEKIIFALLVFVGVYLVTIYNKST